MHDGGDTNSCTGRCHHAPVTQRTGHMHDGGDTNSCTGRCHHALVTQRTGHMHDGETLTAVQGGVIMLL